MKKICLDAKGELFEVKENSKDDLKGLVLLATIAEVKEWLCLTNIVFYGVFKVEDGCYRWLEYVDEDDEEISGYYPIVM